MPQWIQEFVPVLILLAIVGVVFWRLPSVDVGHDRRYLRRRIMNWLPLGLTYAFLYMGRYNLKVSQYAFEEMAGPDGAPLMGNTGFGIIFMVGTIVYGVSFLVNGPLTDRMGGRFSILVGAAGATVMNLLMGLCALSLLHDGPLALPLARHFLVVFSILYAANMYFQSFGAVAIVKVNAPWFHVRERGVFGAIFGILISLGIYFAFDIGYMILGGLGLAWVFLMPALLLAAFWVIDWFVVRNTPGEAGLVDFNTGDATSGDSGPRLGAGTVFRRMLTNPIILTIAGVEFCSGFLRQAIMQWYGSFAKQTDAVLGLKSSFVNDNWGLLLCIAGITGGVFAGFISDHVFQSRRGSGGRLPLRDHAGRGGGAVLHLHHAHRGLAGGGDVDGGDRRARHALGHRQHGLRRGEERGHCRGHHRRLRLSWHGRHVADLRPGAAEGGTGCGRPHHGRGHRPGQLAGVARGDDPGGGDRPVPGRAAVERQAEAQIRVAVRLIPVPGRNPRCAAC